MSKTLLVTGGAGFIGSNYCRCVLAKYPDYRIVVLDALTYAGNLSTLADIVTNPAFAPRFRFYPGKIQDETVVNGILEAEQITHIINFAAESHNDRSILDPGSFIQTDVTGVCVLLDAVRRHKLERLVHISTDEVYGTIETGRFTEHSPIEPNTPYSASKAGGELQCRAHWTTYSTPVIVTRCSNNFGPYQYPEKLIPFFVSRLLDHRPVPLYGVGEQVRDWIYVADHCSGIDFALHHGTPGEVYNIGSDGEQTNISVVHRLLQLLDRPMSLIRYIPDPRGGAHDRRYSVDASKLGALGWRPNHSFEEALVGTVRWYQEHQDWWREIVARPDYQAFLQRFYGPSLGAEL